MFLKHLIIVCYFLVGKYLNLLIFACILLISSITISVFFNFLKFLLVYFSNVCLLFLNCFVFMYVFVYKI